MPYTLHLADCLTIIDDLPHIDAVVTDPPYGAKTDTDYTRFSGGLSPSRNHHQGIKGDDLPFDPAPWLSFPKVVLFGYQYFAAKVPVGTILVWNKKRPTQLGTFMSDCELAWQKGGHGVYLFNHVWHGFDRESERGKTLHPTQKPVALFKWIIERQKLKPGATILDPYLGSGATGIAALELGFNFIGAEIEPSYFEIAKQRIEAKASELGVAP